jgi:hypothetical protein
MSSIASIASMMRPAPGTNKSTTRCAANVHIPMVAKMRCRNFQSALFIVGSSY